MLTRGFTLIEVMVTLVILMFGLLGIVGLMAKGQRASFEAFQRQQALALASDMAERVIGNRGMVLTYTAGAPVTSPVGLNAEYGQLSGMVNCTFGPCTAPELAAFDIALWDGLLNGYSESRVVGATRTGGIVNARGCIEDTGNTAAACPAVGTTTNRTFTQSARVSVAWQGNDDTVAPPAAFTCGNGIYGDERKRRVVALELMVLVPCP